MRVRDRQRQRQTEAASLEEGREKERFWHQSGSGLCTPSALLQASHRGVDDPAVLLRKIWVDTLELFLDLVDSRSQAHVLAGMGPQAGGQPACRQHQAGSLLSPPLLAPPRSLLIPPPSPPGPLREKSPWRGLWGLCRWPTARVQPKPLARSSPASSDWCQALRWDFIRTSVLAVFFTALERRYYCPPSTDETFEAQEVKGSAQGHMLGRRSPWLPKTQLPQLVQADCFNQRVWIWPAVPQIQALAQPWPLPECLHRAPPAAPQLGCSPSPFLRALASDLHLWTLPVARGSRLLVAPSLCSVPH